MLRYEDGNLYWLPEYCIARRKPDKAIGSFKPGPGYHMTSITLNGVLREYYTHRLIWWLLRDEWPEVVDHKDRNTQNNHIENLRAATTLDNMRNRTVRRGNPTGFVGVRTEANGFRATLVVGDNYINSCGYRSKEAAAMARDIMAYLINGDFAALNILDNPTLSVN
ncbi:HNH endonuclease [Salmonella enterica]|nr:HNH endonuclease [Salmonella enterica]